MEQEKTCYFRCNYTHDLSVQKEFAQGAVHAKPINRFASIAVILMLAWYYPLMVFYLEAPGEYCKAVLTFASIFLAVEGIRSFTSRGGGLHYKRMVFSHGGSAPQYSIAFLEDGILSRTNPVSSENHFQYRQIRRICETEHLYLLEMQYQLYLIVDKRTLTGSREDFIAFLLPRCVNLKKQKIFHDRPGRLLKRGMWIVLLLSTMLSVLHHPALQLKERLSGQLHNGMSCTQIAEELETFGITGLDQEMLHTYDEIYKVTFFAEGSKLKMLLRMIGQGEYDMDTQQWASPTGGVCFFSYYIGSTSGMYTDLLTDLSSMTGGELSITEIRESPSDDSTIGITFLLNGEERTLHAAFFGEWYDESILNDVNALLAGSGKQLYFANNDDYSCFLFYCDADWAERFTARTGLELVTDIYEIY